MLFAYRTLKGGKGTPAFPHHMLTHTGLESLGDAWKAYGESIDIVVDKGLSVAFSFVGIDIVKAYHDASLDSVTELVIDA